MHELGADGPGFPIIVAAGPHGARPHHDPGDRPIQRASRSSSTWAPWSTATPRISPAPSVLGDPPPDFVEQYNMVLAAQRQALAGIRAGMTGRDADQIAREMR